MGVLKNVLSDVLTDPVVDPLDRFVTFLPSQLADLKLWTRFNQGITVTGAGVSQWDDQSGNGNHLKQGTDTKRPAKQGDGSILFDGVDNVLVTDAFTLNQPETVYLLVNQVTWTEGDKICDGVLNNSCGVQQAAPSPEVRLNAGLVIGNISPALGNYVVISAVANGASSVLQLDNDSPITGDAGTNNMGGFTLGSRGGADLGFSNIQAKEVAVFQDAHTQAERQQMIDYLAKVGGLSI